MLNLTAFVNATFIIKCVLGNSPGYSELIVGIFSSKWVNETKQFCGMFLWIVCTLFLPAAKHQRPRNYLYYCCSWIFCLTYAWSTFNIMLPQNVYSFYFIFHYELSITLSIHLFISQSIIQLNIYANLSVYLSICNINLQIYLSVSLSIVHYKLPPLIFPYIFYLIHLRWCQVTMASTWIFLYPGKAFRTDIFVNFNICWWKNCVLKISEQIFGDEISSLGNKTWNFSNILSLQVI